MNKSVIVIIVVFLLSVVTSVINCNGTRFRTSDNPMSLSQVISNLNALQGATVQSLDGGQGTSMLSQFITDINTNSYSVYSAIAPSPMANLPTQIATFAGPPDNWGGFASTPPLPVTALWLYFIVSADGTQAGLVIAGAGGSSQTTASPTPIPTASASPASTTTTTTATPNFYFVALNDGSTASSGALNAGSFSSVDYEVDLNLDGVSTISLQTEDLSNGDLADVVKFDVYNSTQGTYIGSIHLSQPTN